jgi:hypothetical protein
MSGLRVFDIRDPYHPHEIAYANFPTNATKPGEPASSFAMSAPAFDSARGEIWYADGNSGFYVVRLTNDGDGPARVLLLGGIPFTEELVMWWNFVGRSHDEIVGYRRQWEQHDERFGSVSGFPGRRLAAPPLPNSTLLPRPNR